MSTHPLATSSEIGRAADALNFLTGISTTDTGAAALSRADRRTQYDSVEIGISCSRANCFWLPPRLSYSFSNRFRSLMLYLRCGLPVLRTADPINSVNRCSLISPCSWWINCDAIYRFNATAARQCSLGRFRHRASLRAWPQNHLLRELARFSFSER